MLLAVNTNNIEFDKHLRYSELSNKIICITINLNKSLNANANEGFFAFHDFYSECLPSGGKKVMLPM